MLLSESFVKGLVMAAIAANMEANAALAYIRLLERYTPAAPVVDHPEAGHVQG